MEDTSTQWFILSKPYVKYRKISIDEEIENAQNVVKKLKKEKRIGVLMKRRHSRIKAAAGILMKVAPGADNKVIGYEIPEGESSAETMRKVTQIWEHLALRGYNPEIGCVRDHFTRGLCKIRSEEK